MRVLAALFAVAVAIAVGVAYLAGSGIQPTQSAQTKTTVFDPQKAYEDGLRVEKMWREAKGVKGAFPPLPSYIDQVDQAIGEIPLDWPKAQEAIALVQRLRSDRPAIEVAYEAATRAMEAEKATALEVRKLAERKSYAPRLEELFLDGGRDVYVSTEGKGYRTLRIRYILMSRPLVHQLSKSNKIIDGWREIGFRKVVFTDGYRETWTLPLD